MVMTTLPLYTTCTNNKLMARNAHDLHSDKDAWRVGDIVTVKGVPKYYVCEIMPVFGPMLKGITAIIHAEDIERIFLK
jgi:hypothetical protein